MYVHSMTQSLPLHRQRIAVERRLMVPSLSSFSWSSTSPAEKSRFSIAASSASRPPTCILGTRAKNQPNTCLKRDRRKQMSVFAAQGDLSSNDIYSPQVSSKQNGTLEQNHVPLYVMLPLDTVTSSNTVNRLKALQISLRALKLVGVAGVMIHVWWGIVEGENPKHYNWYAYELLLKLIKSEGLKIQVCMCFHGCSKLTVDVKSNISLPTWILAIGDMNLDIFYTDKSGNRYKNCLSLAVDTLPLLSERSPLQVYQDFLKSFRENFHQYIGSTIMGIVMDLGPDGELRYPAFQEGSGLWRFPGIGEFQCYDRYMVQSLRNYAAEIQGKAEWKSLMPLDPPFYNDVANHDGFCNEQFGSWKTPPGDLFLSWYSDELIAHGDRMLRVVKSVFDKDAVAIMGKVPVIHWWYKTSSHPAELTAGYYNIEGRDGYEKVVQMFSKRSAMMILPSMEIVDKEQPVEACCSPEMLLVQIRKVCAKHGVPVAGQNSSPRYDDVAFARIKSSIYRLDYPFLPRVVVFTFLRMGQSLFSAEHWRLFVSFVRNLNHGNGWTDFSSRPGFSSGGGGRTSMGSFLNCSWQFQY